MHSDVLLFRDWYRTLLGRAVQGIITTKIKATLGAWRPEERVLFIGYGVPYGESEHPLTFCAFPAGMGVLHWPEGFPNRTLLAWEHEQPFFDGCFDKIILIHALEGAESTRALLAECGRLLKPDGRLLIFVANRSSIWARRESTPFARGQPYSKGQLARLLRKCGLQVLGQGRCVHIPPFGFSLTLKHARWIEKYGERFLPWLGGVVYVEAKRDLMAGKTQRVLTRATVKLPELRPQTATLAHR